MDDEEKMREKELNNQIKLYIMELIPEDAKERVKTRRSTLAREFWESGEIRIVAAAYMIACNDEDISREERIEQLEFVYEALVEDRHSFVCP